VLPKLKQYVESNHISNVSFMGAYRRSDQNKIISSCDLSLISLSDNMYGLGVPSKSYNIMAAGSPILFIGDASSEIALTVKENELGYVVNNNEADIIEFLRNLHLDQIPQMQQFAKNARYVAETKFSRVHILEKYKNLFLD
jgi:glycosyltransferase involved in cell wall biosynthesis